MTFVINPYRQRYKGDATVKASDILACEFIRQGNRDDFPNNWFQVYTKDGRFIQTELYRNDHNILHLMSAMQAAGAKVYVINV